MSRLVPLFSQSVLSPVDFGHSCSTLETRASKLKDRLSRKLEVKFNNLKRNCGIPLESNSKSDDIIFSYSRRALTEAEKWWWREDYVSVYHSKYWVDIKPGTPLRHIWKFIGESYSVPGMTADLPAKLSWVCWVQLRKQAGEPVVICEAAESFEDEA